MEIKVEVVDDYDDNARLSPAPPSFGESFTEPDQGPTFEEGHKSFERVGVSGSADFDPEIVKREEEPESSGGQGRAEVTDWFVLVPKGEYGGQDGDKKDKISDDNRKEREAEDDDVAVLTPTGQVTQGATLKNAVEVEERVSQRSPEVKQPLQDGSILCLICDCKSKPWVGKWKGSLYLLESFCKVLELPSNEPFEAEVIRSCYCFICQRRVVEVVHLAAEVERLQNRIVEIKTEIKCKMEKCLEVPVAKKGTKEANAAQELKGVSLRTVIIDGIRNANLKKRRAFRNIDSDSEADENFVAEPQSSFEDVNYYKPSQAENEVSESRAFNSLMEVETENDSDFEPLRPKSKSGPSKAPKSRKCQKSTDTYDVPKVKLVDDGTIPLNPKRKVPKSDPKRPVNCDLCHKGFKDEVRRNDHVKRRHKGLDRTYCCDFDGCTKSFKTLRRLQSHQLIHTGATPFVCELCGKGFRQNDLLLSHQLLKHHEEFMKFKCDHDQCDKAFKSMDDLSIHKMTHTKEYPFTCEICGNVRRFTSTSFLQHIRVYHSVKNPFRCNFENCGKQFAAKVNLIQHKFIHTQDYLLYCSECGLGLVTENKLKQHMKIMHSMSTVYECDVCQKTFQYKYCLTKHLMSHTGEKPICGLCGKSFIDRSKLRRHHQLIHTGEKGFACDLCDKTFYTKDRLKTHVTANHNGKRIGNE